MRIIDAIGRIIEEDDRERLQHFAALRNIPRGRNKSETIDNILGHLSDYTIAISTPDDGPLTIVVTLNPQETS